MRIRPMQRRGTRNTTDSKKLNKVVLAQRKQATKAERLPVREMSVFQQQICNEKELQQALECLAPGMIAATSPRTKRARKL